MSILNATTTAKRLYSQPKMLRVVLNHDQAVLSACSQNWTRLNQGVLGWCRRTCRKKTREQAVDYAATS